MAKINDELMQLKLLVVNGDATRKEISDTEDKIKELSSENKKLHAEQKKLAKSGKEESDRYKEITKQIKDNEEAIATNRAKIDNLRKSIDLTDLSLKELSVRQKDLRSAMDKLQPNTPAWRAYQKELLSVNKRLIELRNQTTETSGKFTKFFQSGTKLFGGIMLVVGAAKGVFRAIQSVVGGVYNKIKEFEQANVNLSTILGVNVSEMKRLTDSALELGRTTEYSASQVTNLQTELAKLGFNQDQILNMQKPILQFATAVGADLPAAAALAGATLRTFGQTSKDADDVLATLAVSCNKSALSFDFLQTAMSIVGPVAKNFGFSVKDTVALLGTLANSGFDASSAATATRNILLNLADSSGKLAKELGGPVKTLPDLINGLKKLDASGVSLAETLQLTDKRSVAAFNTLLHGADSTMQLRESLEDVGGELDRIQKERLNTIEGSVKLLSSSWESLKLAFYNSKGFFKGVIDEFTGILNGVTALLTPSKSLVEQYDDQIERMATLQTEIPPLIDTYNSLKSKTELNAEETTQLKETIRQLADTCPLAVTAFDEYGNAIEINTERIDEFLSAEKDRLKFLNKDAIEELEKGIKEKQEQLKSLKWTVETGKFVNTYTGQNFQLDDAALILYRRRLAKTEGELRGMQAQLKRLNGESIEEAVQARINQRKAAEADRVARQAEIDAANAAAEQKKKAREATVAAFKALDEKEIKERTDLQRQYMDGSIASEQEYNDKLQQLAISSLQRRLQSAQLTGKERAQAEEQLNTLLLQQRKKRQDQENQAESLRIQNMTDATEKENAEYEQRKRQYAGNAAALEQLEIQHQRNLTKIALQQATALLKDDEAAYKQEREIIKAKYAGLLQQANLSKRERQNLKRQEAEELLALDNEYFSRALEQWRIFSETGEMEALDINGILQSINLDTSLLSEDEKNTILRRIAEVKAAWEGAKQQMQAAAMPQDATYSFHVKEADQGKQTGLFGISKNDWDVFFSNLEQGKFGVEDIQFGLTSMAGALDMTTSLYSSYDKMMSARENSELKSFKKNQDKKKKQLQSRLDAGLISQEQYTAETERMDAEYEKKQEEIQLKQAKRQKAINLMEATIATATAITKALPNIPLAVLAGAMGAAQIAMIAATPLPGAEIGGILVERTQDGKVFQASVDPDRRGYVGQPTVLVGENGMEYVIPAEAMQNPTATPIIDLFESVRRRGQLRDFDFSAVAPAMIRTKGRAAGGTIDYPIDASWSASTPASDDRLLTELMERLLNRLSAPLKAEVALMGKGGFLEKMDEYNRMKNKSKNLTNDTH